MKTFPASLQHLAAMMNYCKEHYEQTTFSKETCHKLEIAIEEALVNIIHYAYPKQDNGTISLHPKAETALFELTIIDEGIAYNPIEHLQANYPRISGTKQHPGGLGIYLLVKLFDDVQYQRKEEKNILTLRQFHA